MSDLSIDQVVVNNGIMQDSAPKTIETRVSALFKIRYPIIQGGMIWASGWKLATAVSKAGGLGLIGAGSMSPSLLAEHIFKAREVWDGALGVNIPLMREDASELVQTTIDSGIRIVFTSAGNPGKYTPLLHDNGCVVAHVVPSLKLALKAAERGVDLIVGEGFEAGGHNGYEEIPTFPLIPRLVDHIDLPIVAAGGVRDGRGMAAAMALGAEGVQLGTRFACSEESSVSENYRKAVIESGEPATVLTLKALSPTRMLTGQFSHYAEELSRKGATIEELKAFLGHGRAKAGTFYGDVTEGYMEAGEVAGDIDSILPAGQIVSSMVREFVSEVRRLSRLTENYTG